MGSRKVLVAVLNWGLGHAARSIPLIKELKKYKFKPVIASDGAALSLLKKEFPGQKFHELPSYNIQYAEKAENLKWKLMLQTPHILKTIRQEKKLIDNLIEQEDFHGIISDSRFGAHSTKVPSVFLTHQLKVLSGKTTFLSTYLHQQYIRKFDQCWIPDAPGEGNLSGRLGHQKPKNIHLKYLGILSRLEKKKVPQKYDILVLLSGPEPQRTLLEKKLLKELEFSSKMILFVRGIFSEERIESKNTSIEIHNYMYGRQLEHALNESDMIIARSGYTTLLDLAKLEKKAFFIPTPGQPEQVYLAARLEKLSIAPSCEQESFKIEMLGKTKNYSGLSNPGTSCDFGGIFALFEGK